MQGTEEGESNLTFPVFMVLNRDFSSSLYACCDESVRTQPKGHFAGRLRIGAVGLTAKRALEQFALHNPELSLPRPALFKKTC